MYVTAANAPRAPVDRIDVRVKDGAEAPAVERALRKALRASSQAQVFTKAQWTRSSYPETKGTTRLGVLLVLGIALLHTGIALANTLLMATSDRTRELTALRPAGATTGQVLRLVAAEAVTVVAVGALLGLLVTVLNPLGMRGALHLLSAPAPLTLPWPALGGGHTSVTHRTTRWSPVGDCRRGSMLRGPEGI